ncbi:methyltransferase [Lithospermum erythrorhizon]|uniref:Methyltransferase n=1 Tax=Lithospermum erythrorhizon TaxID=34254 RepID=A0AAV3P018_LITER
MAMNDAHLAPKMAWVVYSPNFIKCGVEDVMMGYIFGKKKSTEVAHSLWNHIIKNGDTVVDATCGNGYDTLAMLRMVADSTLRGRVYAMDVQQVALEKTSALLDQHVTANEKELVELFAMCHSNLGDVIPHGIPVRLVAFNLGYLPGGNKKVMTRSETTRPALEAAKRILAPGGLISIMVYVGHAGGREEFETVQAFASGLHVENWSCCKLEMLNRPLAPVLVLLWTIAMGFEPTISSPEVGALSIGPHDHTHQFWASLGNSGRLFVARDSLLLKNVYMPLEEMAKKEKFETMQAFAVPAENGSAAKLEILKLNRVVLD